MKNGYRILDLHLIKSKLLQILAWLLIGSKLNIPLSFAIILPTNNYLASFTEIRRVHILLKTAVSIFMV